MDAPLAVLGGAVCQRLPEYLARPKSFGTAHGLIGRKGHLSLIDGVTGKLARSRLPVPSKRTAETKVPMAQPKIAKVRKRKAERIDQQIRTLVELEKSDDEIAAFLGVTVGSSQVTCSQLGLNLHEAQEK